MVYKIAGIPYSPELYHHGIKGQKWGIRRYQNPDGSLTDAGLRRYGTVENFQNAQKLRSATRDYNKALSKAYRKTGLYITDRKRQKSKDAWNNAHDAAKNYKNARKAYEESRKIAIKDPNSIKARKEHLKKAIKVGAGLAAAGLVAYGAHKMINKGNLEFVKSQYNSDFSKIFNDYSRRNVSIFTKQGYGDKGIFNKNSLRSGSELARKAISRSYHIRMNELKALNDRVNNEARANNILKKIGNAAKYYTRRG